MLENILDGIQLHIILSTLTYFKSSEKTHGNLTFEHSNFEMFYFISLDGSDSSHSNKLRNIIMYIIDPLLTPEASRNPASGSNLVPSAKLAMSSDRRDEYII